MNMIEMYEPAKYYVNHKEVTKEEYIAAELRNGFHSMFGPGHLATSSFSNCSTGDCGMVEYAAE